MNKTVVLKDDKCINHVTSYGHPESPRRLEAIYDMLKDDAVGNTVEIVEPREATKEELALNHSSDYIAMIEQTAGKPFVSLDPDTNTSEGSWQAAILAAGAVLQGIDLIIQGTASNGFALVRPPGHHAEKNRAMGFCLFNNIAIGAHYLLKNHHMQRVLIIDWDIHHGNGTQNAFYEMPEVLYFSTHQYPYYPGSGALQESGVQSGTGFTVNVPLSGGQGDYDYIKIFKEIVQPITEKYKPEFILVSAGYDIYCRDPLGTMNVTPDGFYMMASALKNMAASYCGGKILFALEGGYNVEGVAESVKYTLQALTGSGTEHAPDKDGQANQTHSGGSIDQIIAQVKKIHAVNWFS